MSETSVLSDTSSVQAPSPSGSIVMIMKKDAGEQISMSWGVTVTFRKGSNFCSTTLSDVISVSMHIVCGRHCQGHCGR